MAWLFLLGAIVFEVFGTLNLRLSDGMTRLWPSVGVVVGYAAAIYLLSLALRTVPVGVAYGIWSALGTVLVALIGFLLLGDRLTPVQVGGIVLVVAGVVALEVGGPH